MNFDPSDSSGTDDDLPPSHQNRVARGGHVGGNGRTFDGAIANPRMQNNDMETQIHRLEQEAYSSILRAFKAQSDAITWEKEGLITELRKELRVTDEEHRELLSSVNADDIIRRIREWRQAGGVLTGVRSNAQSDVPVPSSSTSHKRQKISQAIPSLPMVAPSPVLPSQPVLSMQQPSSTTAKKATTSEAKGKKPKLYSSGGPGGRGQSGNRNSSALLVAAESAPTDLIGQKVLTRWPDDNNFYEAVITDYNRLEGLHALVYDINTNNETWEWVNLKEFSPEDIQWKGDNPGINNQSSLGPPGHGIKRPAVHDGAPHGAGSGRGAVKNQMKKNISPTQNGIGKRNNGDIHILHTETLLKEIEKVFNTTHPDPLEVDKAKKALREHEQSLIDAIARLADTSDGESDGNQQLSHGQAMNRDRGWRSQQYGGNQHGANYDDGMIGARDGLNDHIIRGARALDHRYNGDDYDI